MPRPLAVLPLLLALVLAGVPLAAGPLLEPSTPGWERLFLIDWEAGERAGRPLVRGSLRNESPYSVARIQLLVDALDAGGNVVSQQLAWASPGSLEPFTRAWFEVAMPQAAPQYRVRVYSYDRLEAPSRE